MMGERFIIGAMRIGVKDRERRGGSWRFLISIMLTVPQFGVAEGNLVTPDALSLMSSAASPGDTLVIKNGTYLDQDLELRGKGTAQAPITITTETPGKVVFAGKSTIELIGEHVVIDGLRFAGGAASQKPLISIQGTHCRVTNSVIAGAEAPGSGQPGDQSWILLSGDYHRIDYCTFSKKVSPGPMVMIRRVVGKEDHHEVMSNHFLRRLAGSAGRSYETICIGSSAESESSSFTTIKSNLFEECDGEDSLLSVNAGECLILDNTFRGCGGLLDLRYGGGTRVERNLFAGLRKQGAGGIRVRGADHQILGNAFIGLTGRGGGALSLMTGVADPGREGDRRAENIFAKGNLFAANLGPAICLDERYGQDNHSLLPRGIRLLGNVLSGDDLAKLVVGGDKLGLELSSEKNQIFANNQIPKDITRAFAPPLTKVDVGAAWYRDQIL